MRACDWQVLSELREATAEEHAGRERNQVAPEQGRFLSWLVETLGVRSAIEIGVFTGYSSLAVALAGPRLSCSDSTNTRMLRQTLHELQLLLSHSYERQAD